MLGPPQLLPLPPPLEGKRSKEQIKRESDRRKKEILILEHLDIEYRKSFCDTCIISLSGMVGEPATNSNAAAYVCAINNLGCVDNGAAPLASSNLVAP